MNVPDINDIIAEDCETEDDIDATQIEEISLPAYANCENVVYGYLWNQHYQNKIQHAEYSNEEECYSFYSLNSFTHDKINFVCNHCFDLSKYVWYNAIPNAFSKRHHCHTSYIIYCDKCKNLCNRSPQNGCTYLTFHHGIETNNMSANCWVNVSYNFNN